MKFVYVLVILIVIILLSSCNACNKEAEKATTATGDTLTKNIAIKEVMENRHQSSDISNGIVKNVKSNTKEKMHDSLLASQILVDLQNSEYQNCSQILEDYKKRLAEFRKGNRKPLKEFQEKDDPNIILCSKKDKLFAKTLDSLRNEGIKLVDAYAKSLGF